MKIIGTKIDDVKVIEPTVYEDERGFFYESFNQKIFELMIGRKLNFVQDNHSRSLKGVLRGLHYQNSPHAQGKLIRVVHGVVFDVAVDIRKDSPTYRCWVSEILSSENKKQMWIPEGFAHGFMTLSETADVLYKTTDYYCPASAQYIYWADETLAISWPSIDAIITSERDSNASNSERINPLTSVPTTSKPASVKF